MRGYIFCDQKKTMLRRLVSEREAELPVSTIGNLLSVAHRPGTVSLGPGEPDFSPPPHVLRAAKRAIDRKETRYTDPRGIPELRDAVARKLRKENRVAATAENVLITNGTTEGILLGLLATVDPGEAVLYPDPGFLAYRPAIEVISGAPLAVKLREADGFQMTPESLEDAVLPEKTRVLILNSPGNPTGAVFSRKTLEAVAAVVVEYDLLVISDEVYEKFVYDDAKHVSIASLNGMGDRVLTLFSCSKTYGMPGFRIGAAAGPKKLIGAMAKLHVFSSICAGSISQRAALAALRGPQTNIRKQVREYDRRRRVVVDRLNELPGISCATPRGAFYAFANISGTKMRSLRFAQRLLAEAKVAVVPGSEFGRAGEGFVRISYATAPALLERGLDRMERWLRKQRR